MYQNKNPLASSVQISPKAIIWMDLLLISSSLVSFFTVPGDRRTGKWNLYFINYTNKNHQTKLFLLMTEMFTRLINFILRFVIWTNIMYHNSPTLTVMQSYLLFAKIGFIPVEQFITQYIYSCPACNLAFVETDSCGTHSFENMLWCNQTCFLFWHGPCLLKRRSMLDQLSHYHVKGTLPYCVKGTLFSSIHKLFHNLYHF